MRACSILLVALCGLAPYLAAADYPERPVRFVVEFPAGGAVDVIARRIAGKLTERFGQQFIVDNRSGAGGVIAHEFVAKARADGYTLLLATTPLAANPALYKKLPYDAAADFVPVSFIADWAALLVVHPSVPARSFGEFVKLAKARPGELTYSSAGVGSFVHLAPELLFNRAGIKVTHVPYKGAVPALTDVLAGFISAKLDSYVTSIPHMKTGRLRALGVSSAERMLQVPEVPTLAEQGYPGFAAAIWLGLVVPKGTPGDIVTRLEAAATAAVKDKDVSARLVADGIRPVGGSAKELDALMRAEQAQWSKLIRDIGLKPQ
ncbi:MAG: tripartite tricarboxylate transporter substrate binding protein [Burkholderiales bacterium]|nr:tripartite tricarboxylate transporter substrate binding protein [Burkholderiales bacterium]